ncbi:hypothetical protein ACJIZ3_001443 [Penstemon smallii]|uniref:Uncharacterized protein n=1 Tax=Penstemon smallii TaxID=265156 RepID=A0ABD3U3Z9_9LAMI
MPRPGPRPYECVRRAWHSDRHQPIRGSLIQEIFRIVSEVHGSCTKKNREWQEKLPVVVLKAEEIMYSKANSEAEYSDFKTLWDRVNDAINTIIRRDESTETGVLLQPCIEAALNLGCTPRRSSRSQRNESPRCYLRPETQDATSLHPSNSNTTVYGNHTNNIPLMFQCPQFLTPFNMNYLHSSSKTDNNANKLPILLDNTQTHASYNTWSVYPLYYNNQLQPDDPKLHTMKPWNSSFHQMESDNQLGFQQNLDASNFSFPTNHEHTLDKGHAIKCDLTLRLGSLPCPSTEPPYMEYAGSRTHVEERKLKRCFRK